MLVHLLAVRCCVWRPTSYTIKRRGRRWQHAEMHAMWCCCWARRATARWGLTAGCRSGRMQMCPASVGELGLGPRGDFLPCGRYTTQLSSNLVPGSAASTAAARSAAAARLGFCCWMTDRLAYALPGASLACCCGAAPSAPLRCCSSPCCSSERALLATSPKRAFDLAAGEVAAAAAVAGGGSFCCCSLLLLHPGCSVGSSRPKPPPSHDMVQSYYNYAIRLRALGRTALSLGLLPRTTSERRQAEQGPTAMFAVCKDANTMPSRVCEPSRFAHPFRMFEQLRQLKLQRQIAWQMHLDTYLDLPLLPPACLPSSCA